MNSCCKHPHVAAVRRARVVRRQNPASTASLMTHGQTLDLVRSFARRWFDRFGANVNEAICESLLVRNGHYCGRRFDCGGYHAVWFIEENEIKLYDRESRLLHSEQLAEASKQPLRAAA